MALDEPLREGQMLRKLTIVISAACAVALVWAPIPAASAPTGLDCDQFPEIPSDRCASWKERNADGKWWASWNLETGAIESVYAARKLPPGQSAVALVASEPPQVDLAEGGANNVVDFEIPFVLLESLAQGKDQIAIFMHLTAFDGDGPLLSRSHIEGAGRFLKDASHPFTIYIPSTAPGTAGSCSCDLDRRDQRSKLGSLVGALLLSAVVWRRRRVNN